MEGKWVELIFVFWLRAVYLTNVLSIFIDIVGTTINEHGFRENDHPQT